MPFVLAASKVNFMVAGELIPPCHVLCTCSLSIVLHGCSFCPQCRLGFVGIRKSHILPRVQWGAMLLGTRSAQNDGDVTLPFVAACTHRLQLTRSHNTFIQDRQHILRRSPHVLHYVRPLRVSTLWLSLTRADDQKTWGAWLSRRCIMRTSITSGIRALWAAAFPSSSSTAITWRGKVRWAVTHRRRPLGCFSLVIDVEYPAGSGPLHLPTKR